MLTVKAILNLIVYWMTALIPRDRRLAVFGAWGGDKYCDNPKYLMLYLLEHSGYKCVWVGKEHLRAQMPAHKNFRFVLHGSWAAVYNALRAKFIFCCLTERDVSNGIWQGGARRINLWHGIPLKYMGEMTPYKNERREKVGPFRQFRRKVFNSLSSYTFWTVSASRRMSDIMVACYPRLFSHKRILEVGTPRNDYILLNASNAQLKAELKNKYSRLLGFPVDKKVVLYMPTWRMRDGNAFTFSGADYGCKLKVAKTLQAYHSVLIEKLHQSVLAKSGIDSTNGPDFFVVGSSVNDEIDPQELYLITDVLITDYSSAYIDFALLKRPCVHFVYDYDEYRDKDSGLAYDLQKVAAGPCVKTFDEMVTALRNALESGVANPMAGYEELVKFEKGECCSRMLGLMKE